MKKVLFLANHFVTLYNMRRELIEQLLRDGHEVVLSIPADPDNAFFRDLGCRIIETDISRRGLNPLQELKLLRQYIRILRTEKPDVVFSYTIKPNVYGSIASRITHSRQICNITGTGETFNHGALMRTLAQMLYRVSIRHSAKVFFQNSSDMSYCIDHRLVKKENSMLIPGSGVNLERFPCSPMPEGEQIRFIYIGRVMQLKGIDEYLEAARIIRAERDDVRFYIAGFAESDDYKNLVEQSHTAGIVDYIGFRKDISEWIRRCHCTVLPSHGGEGIPNVLLESAATGRVCIASRIPGCVDVVEDGKTGYLFPAGDAGALADAIRRFLACTPEQRTRMGLAGRARVEAHFDRNTVVNIYRNEI